MDKLLAKWAQSLVHSYHDHGGVNASGAPGLSSKPQVATLCLELMQLLFPGYHDGGAVEKLDLAKTTRQRVQAWAEDLQHMIHAALGSDPAAGAKAADSVRRLFEELPSIRQTLQTDVEAAYEGDPSARTREEIILSYPFIEAIAVQRVAHLLYVEGVPLIPRMMTEWAHAQTGIDIHPGATIGSHFFIDHGTGVVIGETCHIGSRVKLYHGVTLGARSFEKDEAGRLKKGGKRHPNVEDGVTIYPNATVLGGETVIGRNSTIGGNVFLLHSVPPNSLVHCEEAKIRVLAKTGQGGAADYAI
ncbi:MAG: serine O-acetyltransferase EpsC [Chthoniobacterales bacterium]